MLKFASRGLQTHSAGVDQYSGDRFYLPLHMSSFSSLNPCVERMFAGPRQLFVEPLTKEFCKRRSIFSTNSLKYLGIE